MSLTLIFMPLHIVTSMLRKSIVCCHSDGENVSVSVSVSGTVSGGPIIQWSMSRA